MKTINNFIDEKLKISSKSKFYSCQPKNKFELRKILEERLAEDKNANLNDIDVSEITDMGYADLPENYGLFEGLDPCNIDISEWDVSKVRDMRAMFWNCYHFNCNLNNWNVSNVENMWSLFKHCNQFNSDLSKWDVSKVLTMEAMFEGCHNFTGKGIEKWDVSNVENMDFIFYDCESLKRKPKWYKNK